MSRIYVGQSFQAGDVPEVFLNELERLLARHPAALALLEFTSPGQDHRQIDCAILSPGGVDLIEIKNKRGVVRGTADGEWIVTDPWYGRDRIVNFKNGVSENPHQQAANSADDLKDGLRALLNLRKGCPSVFPMVLVPAPAAGSSVEPHSNVRAALGMAALPGALRAYPKASSKAWDGLDYRDVPKRLGLQQTDVSSVRGRVVSAETGEGVPGVEILLDGLEQALTTDAFGGYEFWAPLGGHVELALSAPEQYLTPAEPQRFTTIYRSVEVTPIRLASRYPSRVVDEVRQAIQADLEARLQAQVEVFQNAHGAMQAVVDDLTRQLGAAQARLAAQEAALSAAPRPAAPSLTERAQQASLLRVTREQHQHVELALRQLEGQRPSPAQTEAVRRSVDLLARLDLSARQRLEAPGNALPVQVQPILVTERLRAEPASPAVAPDVQDAEWRAAPERTPTRAPWLPWAVVLGAALIAAGLAVPRLLPTRSDAPTTAESASTQVPAVPNATRREAQAIPTPAVPIKPPTPVRPTPPVAAAGSAAPVAQPSPPARQPRPSPEATSAQQPQTPAPLTPTAPIRSARPATRSAAPVRAATTPAISARPAVAQRQVAPQAEPAVPTTRPAPPASPAPSPQPTADATNLPGEVVGRAPNQAAQAAPLPDSLPGEPVN